MTVTQTTVQHTLDGTQGLKGAGKRAAAESKEPGGFADLLASFFGKGDALGSLDGKGEGDELTTSTLKGLKLIKKGAGKPLVDGKAETGPHGTHKKGDDGEEIDASMVLPLSLAGVAQSLPVALGTDVGGNSTDPLLMAGGKTGSAAGKGSQQALASNGHVTTSNMAQAPVTDLGTDQFASALREMVANGKSDKAASTTPSPQGGGAKVGEMISPDGDALKATTLAGVTATAGGKKGASELKTGQGAQKSEGALASTNPAILSAVDGGKKRTSAFVGKEVLRDALKVEETTSPTPRMVKPLTADRAATPVTPVATDVTTVLKEMTPTVIADVPRRGLTRQLALQVGRQVATAVKNNDQEVTFQVRPPSLGRLQLHIEKEGETISVRIVSEKEKAGDVLAAGKHDLRAMLSDHGIKVDRIVIDAGGTLDSATRDGSSPDQQGKGRSSPRGQGEDGVANTESQKVAPETKRHEGVLSVMV